MYDKNSRNVKKKHQSLTIMDFFTQMFWKDSQRMCLGYIYIFGFSIFRRFSSHMIDFNGDSLCAYRKSLLIKVDQEVYTGISVSTLLINI